MGELFTKQSIEIDAGRVVSGVAENPQTLRIVSGRVWVTVEGVAQDYWLFGGDTFTVTPGRLTVLEADQVGSRIELSTAHGKPTLRKPSARLRDLALHLRLSQASILHRRLLRKTFQR